MSTPYLFILWVPFATDSGFMERYMDSREAHKAAVHDLIASGTIKLGGPVLSPHADLSAPYAGQEKFGSAIVYEGESVESVRKIVEADPFYSEGVWDTEKLQLHPLRNIVPA